MRNKRIPWAASVYARHLPELREIAEPILREAIEHDTELRWRQGGSKADVKIKICELREHEVEEWSDGCRMDGKAAAATEKRGMYLGEWATVADAEELGVLLAWEESDVVALDSQGVIQRIDSLRYAQPRSWIEERLVAKMQERPKTLMWVKGHSGVKGNERADRKAKATVERGGTAVATPAGGYTTRVPNIPEGSGTFEVVSGSVRGLVYMITDKGPQRQWLWEIGKSEEQWCVCDRWTPQNAAHLMLCPWVGDGKGRKYEELWQDEEWCEAVAGFLL